MNWIKKNLYFIWKSFNTIYIIFCILIFVLSCSGCAKTSKVVVPTTANDNLNNTMNMLKNIKCTNEHLENVREIDFDSVYFGRYEQDGIAENGKEDIEWLILDKDFDKNEVLLISKYSLDYINFGKDFNDLTEQQKEDFFNECSADKRTVDLMRFGGDFTRMYYPVYCNYEDTNLYSFLNNIFYEEAFDENEKSFLLNNNQVIRGKEYNKEKIGLPTKEILSNCFSNDFQRELYGTLNCIDKKNTNINNITYIDNTFNYMYVDNSSKLRLIYNGKLSDENFLYNVIGVRPMIRVVINNLIKEHGYAAEIPYKINNEDNKIISKFLKENNIKLDGIYELYNESLFDAYTELKDYINHNRDTGKEYGTFGYDYYEITYEDDKEMIELSYELVDMDNDDCNELVIFNKDRVLELYTIYKNTLRHLYSSVRGSSLGHGVNIYITKDNRLLIYDDDPISSEYIYYALNKGYLYKEISYYWQNDWVDDYDMYRCRDYMHNQECMVNIKSIEKGLINRKNKIKIIIPYDYKEGIRLAKLVTDNNNQYLLAHAERDYGRYDYDTVVFGKYYDYKDKATNLEWIVLDKEEDRALLLCKEVIDCKCFDDTNIETTYKNSTIRKWLNEEFYNEAFSNVEKNNIIETNNTNINLQGNRDEDTIDKVFLLSLDEVQKYFGELDNIDKNNGYDNIVHNNKAQAFPTTYAKEVDNLGEKLFYSKAEGKDYNGACEWWLRTMNSDHKSTAIVYCNGYAEGLEKEHLINYKNRGVRPAIWVKCK